jgi:hypothetical protein
MVEEVIVGDAILVGLITNEKVYPVSVSGGTWSKIAVIMIVYVIPLIVDGGVMSRLTTLVLLYVKVIGNDE